MFSLFRFRMALICVLGASQILWLSLASQAATVTKRTTPHAIAGKSAALHRPVVKGGAKKAATPASAVAMNPNAFIPFYNQARQFYLAKQYEQTEKPLKQAYALLEQVSLKKPSALSQKNLAIVGQLVGLNAYKLKKYQESERYLKRTLSVYTLPQYQADNQDAILSAWLILGQMAMYESRFSDAQGYYQRALPLQEARLGLADKQTQQIKTILDDIARIDYAPDYLNALGPKVTRWSHPEQAVNIYIEDGSQIPGWNSENRQLVRQAYAEWQQVLGERLHFVFVDDPQVADTIVSWMERPKPAEPSATDANPGKQELRNGECQTQMLETTLAKDNIVIALNNTDGKVYSSNSINNALLHEITHSIGFLGGHSSNPSDILYSNNGYEDGRAKHLTQRDIQTALKLYSYPPDITNPAGIHLVRYDQYMNLMIQGSKAYNQKDFANAANLLRTALSIYNQEPHTRFLLGVSQFQLKAYPEALPYLMSAAAMRGKYQDEALKMTGYTLIKLGEADDKAGAPDLAEQKYLRASQLLNQGLLSIPVKPENQKAILDALTWINQRLAMHSSSPIQWANSAPAQAQTAINPAAPETRKKKGWFSGFTSSVSEYFIPTPVSN